ncbi:uncharacterized protein LOC107804723 [Nicotiana tabacum]|uniref:Uncharacterized protein LOC107804723 n=1 Tax=Nicotiana tabacum TaxID=4097 RepID=A0AC58UMI0_TOBAC
MISQFCQISFLLLRFIVLFFLPCVHIKQQLWTIKDTYNITRPIPIPDYRILKPQYCGKVMLKLRRKCPKECREVVSSLIFAAARLADVPELRQLRSVFTDIYRNSLECYLNKEVRKVTSSMQQRTLPWL